MKPTKRGVRVECAVCGQAKCPRGRDSPLDRCYHKCPGYSQDPQVGSLWPGETDADFGFPCSDVGTEPYVLLVRELDLDLEDGYPTEASLEQITQVKAWTRAECVTLFGHIHDIWTFNDYFTREGDEYKLSTGGWSGNESIIGALQGNLMFWMRCWESSRRGGHFVFRLPEE